MLVSIKGAAYRVGHAIARTPHPTSFEKCAASSRHHRHSCLLHRPLKILLKFAHRCDDREGDFECALRASSREDLLELKTNEVFVMESCPDPPCSLHPCSIHWSSPINLRHHVNSLDVPLPLALPHFANASTFVKDLWSIRTQEMSSSMDLHIRLLSQRPQRLLSVNIYK